MKSLVNLCTLYFYYRFIISQVEGSDHKARLGSVAEATKLDILADMARIDSERDAAVPASTGVGHLETAAQLLTAAPGRAGVSHYEVRPTCNDGSTRLVRSDERAGAGALRA